MLAEFEIAAERGKSLSFAAGCLVAACREIPMHQEGRLLVASHALALGLLIPMAAFQIACAFGLPLLPTGPAVDYAVLAGGGSRVPYLVDAQLGGVPALFMLWSMLSVGQLGLAWMLLERDWSRAFSIGAMIAAVAMTLFLFMAVLLLDASSLVVEAAAIAIEFAGIVSLARWHSQLLFPLTDRGLDPLAL